MLSAKTHTRSNAVDQGGLREGGTASQWRMLQAQQTQMLQHLAFGLPASRHG
jgi:hypothetical protein